MGKSGKTKKLVEEGDMAVLWGKPYTKRELLRRVGDIRQLARVEPFEYTEGSERGVRALRMRNASGLEMVIAAERGMAIIDLFYNGVPLPFLNGAGVSHPAFNEQPGLGWLRTWPGGFLTPCGLTQVGSPNQDEGEELGLHGRVAGIPAREVRWGGDWKDDDYFMWVEGAVRQTVMFGEDVSLRRRVGMWLTGSRFWIDDTIENHAFQSTPLMFLQHFNLGFPLVDATTRLELPNHTTEARDEAARAGEETCLTYSEPQAGYHEQVFYHDLKADANGQVEVRLVNPGFDQGKGLGMYWRYALADYPVLVQWKMMGEGTYVAGIEPANCHVTGRGDERIRGTLQFLQPQEVRRYRIEVGLIS
jgi:hypothetical protein